LIWLRVVPWSFYKLLNYVQDRCMSCICSVFCGWVDEAVPPIRTLSCYELLKYVHNRYGSNLEIW
jgi:hypothetical protein